MCQTASAKKKELLFVSYLYSRSMHKMYKLVQGNEKTVFFRDLIIY